MLSKLQRFTVGRALSSIQTLLHLSTCTNIFFVLHRANTTIWLFEAPSPHQFSAVELLGHKEPFQELRSSLRNPGTESGALHLQWPSSEAISRKHLVKSLEFINPDMEKLWWKIKRWNLAPNQVWSTYAGPKVTFMLSLYINTSAKMLIGLNRFWTATEIDQEGDDVINLHNQCVYMPEFKVWL